MKFIETNAVVNSVQKNPLVTARLAQIPRPIFFHCETIDSHNLVFIVPPINCAVAPQQVHWICFLTLFETVHQQFCSHVFIIPCNCHVCNNRLPCFKPTRARSWNCYSNASPSGRVPRGINKITRLIFDTWFHSVFHVSRYHVVLI